MRLITLLFLLFAPILSFAAGGEDPKGENEAFINNDAVVFGLLLGFIALIFYTNKLASFKTFYKFVPGLLLCYFLPSLLNTFGIADPAHSKLYFVASRFLLPASLILLCLSIDLKAIANLGSKALIMFFAATLGIVIGGPIALWFIALFDPSIPESIGISSISELWKGLATVAGSWIGGGANQTAMKEIAKTPDSLFSAMIIVDIFVANLLMALLLLGTGYRDKINKWFKADNRPILELEKKMENFALQNNRIPSVNDLFIILGFAFVGVGISHFLSDLIAPSIGDFINSKLDLNRDSWWKYFTSFGSGFFWLIVFSTIFGIALSFSKARTYEGAGASKLGSVFLYILVATIGMKMDIGELIENWSIFSVLISIGLIWMLIHVIVLFIFAKIFKAPFFFVAVGSQANVGGAASAPVVASAFNPALAPVGVLLAVFGYAVGTFTAVGCMILMQIIS